MKTIVKDQIKNRDQSGFIRLGNRYEDLSVVGGLDRDSRLKAIGELAKAIQFMTDQGYALPDMDFSRLVFNRNYSKSISHNPLSIFSYKGISEAEPETKLSMLHSFRETVLGIAALDTSGDFPPHLYNWIRNVQKGAYDHGLQLEIVYQDLIRALQQDQKGIPLNVIDPDLDNETFDGVFGEQKRLKELIALKPQSKARLLLNTANQMREVHKMNFCRGNSIINLQFDVDERINGDPQLVFAMDPSPIQGSPYTNNPEEIKKMDQRDIADLSLIMFENSDKIPTRMIEWIWRVRNDHFPTAEQGWALLLGKSRDFIKAD